MNQEALEVSETDPGPGHRLRHQARRSLASQIRDAHKSGVPAVLIHVAADAWDQDPVPDPAGLSAQQVSSDFHRLVVDLFSLQMPVAIHLEGRVTGLGLALALACDVRIASPETRLGIGTPQTPNALVSGVTWLLAHRAGSATVADLAWTGRLIDTDEALGLGLLTSVSEPKGSRALAGELADVPASAASALKRSLNGRLLGEFSAQLEYDSWLATVAAKGAR